jgi:hypothetical protein
VLALFVPIFFVLGRSGRILGEALRGELSTLGLDFGLVGVVGTPDVGLPNVGLDGDGEKRKLLSRGVLPLSLWLPSLSEDDVEETTTLRFWRFAGGAIEAGAVNHLLISGKSYLRKL